MLEPVRRLLKEGRTPSKPVGTNFLKSPLPLTNRRHQCWFQRSYCSADEMDREKEMSHVINEMLASWLIILEMTEKKNFRTSALDMKVMKPRSALPVVTQNIIDAVCNVFDDREGYE